MTNSQLEELKTEVFSRQTVLAEIYRIYGAQMISQYVASWQSLSLGIDNPFLHYMKKGAIELYGQAVAKAVVEEFETSGLVSTIDHHGLFGHPFFLNSNLIFAQRPSLRFLPVFSTAGVSLNNSSWPGCLVLTNPQTGKLVRISLYTDRHKTLAVYGLNKFGFNQVKKVLSQVESLDFLDLDQKTRLKVLLSTLFYDKAITQSESFLDQASQYSTKLWREIFPTAPQLIYLPLERLVADILIGEICFQSRHVLHQLFFTEFGWRLLDKYFYGVRGGYGSGRGSFLFWGLDASARRFALFRNGSVLSGGSGRSIRLVPEEIAAGLEAGQLYPTSLVCFSVLLFYGVTCLGGFNQTTWLTEIKRRFLSLLEELGADEVVVRMSTLPTENFAESGLAFLRTAQGLFKASALDLYIHQVEFSHYAKLAESLTLAQSIESELPEIYRVVVPEPNRRPELSGITLAELGKINGLENSVKHFLPG